MTSRRAVRRAGIGLLELAALAGLATLGAGAWLYAQAGASTVGELDFANPLVIPPLAEPHVGADGLRTFDLTLRAGESDLGSGAPTTTWGANGVHLGPTLRARRGDRVRVRVANDLAEPTTLHWHGMKLPGVMDGGPHQMIHPGQRWEPEWRVDQPAATLWYHPHPHHRTAEHVYRGLVGLFLIDDDHSDDLALPSDYGVDDIPVIVQDVAFDSDGQLEPSEGPANLVGTLGEHLLVNGTHDPHVDVADRRVRLRLLNASGARVYDFGFDDDRPFALVATDGGLLDVPTPVTGVQLSPGERAEIVVELSPGERTALRSRPPELGMSFPLERTNGGHDSFDILELRAADRLRDAPPLPATLADDPGPDPDEAVTTRTFELEGFSRINGREMDLARVDHTIPRGDIEIWEVTNASNSYHNFHIHLIRFRVLDIDGRPPSAELAGWKDTVFVEPGQTARIIARFDAPPDPEAPFMFHCHILDHEDAGMMGQFTLDPAAAR